MGNQIAFSAVLLLGVIAQPLTAGTKVYLGSNTPGRVSFDQVDHSVWDALLQKYVDKDGLVNYQALSASKNDMMALDGYINTLSLANPNQQASAAGKMAFWINAYNAVTVKGILREYPTTSIRNHTAKLVGYNIWKDLQLMVGGQAYSLDAMEHQVLRKMGDPRIHFAIVCASIGCPRLLNQAYVGARLNEQLELNAKDFFSRPQNFRYDPTARRVYLSEILNWFGSDFGANQSAQLNAISRWLPPATQQAVSQASPSVAFLEYDWGLNAQGIRSAKR